MIPDLDIYRSAVVLMRRHGDVAKLEAAQRADVLLVNREERRQPAYLRALGAVDMLSG